MAVRASIDASATEELGAAPRRRRVEIRGEIRDHLGADPPLRENLR